jgi:5'-nucleotidase
MSTRVLLTNDDGYRSEGLAALARALEPLGEITIVAPMTESSAIGHALTLARPLRLERIGARSYCVDGTPTDCVNIALTKVVGAPVALVVSGINKGYNLGDDVTYSGTVAGALEGALLGIPSIAVSLERGREPIDFSQAAGAALQVAEAVLSRGLPPRTFLNVNVPRQAARGFKVTVQARRNHVTSVVEAVDPRRRPYFWIEEGQSAWEPHDRSDYQAVKDGFISITPLHPDLTDHDAVAHLEQFPLRLAAGVE